MRQHLLKRCFLCRSLLLSIHRQIIVLFSRNPALSKPYSSYHCRHLRLHLRHLWFFSSDLHSGTATGCETFTKPTTMVSPWFPITQHACTDILKNETCFFISSFLKRFHTRDTTDIKWTATSRACLMESRNKIQKQQQTNNKLMFIHIQKYTYLQYQLHTIQTRRETFTDNHRR